MVEPSQPHLKPEEYASNLIAKETELYNFKTNVKKYFNGLYIWYLYFRVKSNILEFILETTFFKDKL